MNVTLVRSDDVYRKLMTAPLAQKNDIYRYELMKAFEKKWACYNIPLKAAQPGGYDIIIASDMLGFLLPENIDDRQRENIAALSDDALWRACEISIQKSLACFTQAGVALPVQDYCFSILLANPDNPYVSLCKGYSGDGGIPGYILSWLTPNDDTIRRLPVAVAHEVNHNVRFQWIPWHNDITLGEMIVSEGLAENFATYLYGEDLIGPWVSSSDLDELHHYSKPLIFDALHVQGLAEINAYLYGDDIARLQGYQPEGLPYCAGYACGYYLIKHYLKKTGTSIVEATLIPAEEILKEAADFWKER